MKLSGAEIVARVLEEHGADTVFGYPGGAVLHIYDALYRHADKITHYVTAHEQGAAHAADGYARATGKTGVVIATSGPGATNLVTGIAAAYMDSVPMVAITGNVASTLIGKDSFQEVYTLGITMPVTKHNFMVRRAEDVAPVLREAFHIAASGRPGPVAVDITQDATIALAEYGPAAPRAARKQAPRGEELFGAVRALATARRPVAIIGGGVVSGGAAGEAAQLCRRACVPAVHTLMAGGVLACDDALNLGLAGMHGRMSANLALENADLVLALGFRFSDRVALNPGSFARGAKVIQFDIDRSEAGKNVRVAQFVAGDVKRALQMMLPLTGEADRGEWLARIGRWRADDVRPGECGERLRPHAVVELVTELAGGQAVVTTDVGQHQMWAAQYCRHLRPRGFITSGGLGAMGFGYGAAIGAAIGTGRRVVHFTGDGSFHMNLNEACTAVTYGLPVISVIFNNGVLGLVRQLQYTYCEGRYSATTLNRRTDYVRLAEGFGAVGMRAETPRQLREAMRRALACSGPVWIECVIDKDEMVSPMVPAGGTAQDAYIYEGEEQP